MTRIVYSLCVGMLFIACAEPSSEPVARRIAAGGPSFTYGDAGTYPENGDGSPNENVSASISSVSTTAGLTPATADHGDLLEGLMTTDGWFNEASVDGNFTVKRRGAVVQTHEFTDHGEPTWQHAFTVEYSSDQLTPLSAPLCGSTADGATLHDTWWHAPTPFSADWGHASQSSVSPTYTAAACPPPKPKMLLSFGGASGVTLDISLPDGETATVGIDGSGSAPGEDGGPALSTFDWKISSTDVGGSTSFSSNFTNSKSLTLTVTDADEASASQDGAVNITPVDPCDDPMTREVEDCETNPPSANETVSYGDDTEEPGDYGGGAPSSNLVCYVTDWFLWNGTHWVYDSTTTDYCTFE